MSWPSGYAWPSVVRITTICRLPNRLPDCALDRSQGQPSDAAREIMEAKDETIRILQHQLEEERGARRRADTIIAQLTQLNVALTTRVPGFGDPPIDPPDTEGKAVATAEGAPMTAERGSWWRKRLGGE